MKKRGFHEQLASAVAAVWAEAIPVVALQALWAQYEAKAVYAIADALAPRGRAGMLAWYAFLDPQTRSARALKAASEALRGARNDMDLAAVIALVPLGEPAVLALARRLAKSPRARYAFELRTSAGKHCEVEVERPEHRAVFRALEAVQLFEDGRREEAETLLKEVFGQSFYGHPTIARAVLVAVKRLGAWGALGASSWGDVAQFEGAFLAGLEGWTAVDALVAGGAWPERLTSAALGLSRVPAEWREALAQKSLEKALENYQEGLVTWDEVQVLPFAHALARPEPERAVREQALIAIQEAREPASRFASRVEERMGGPRKDEASVTSVTQRLTRLVANPAEKTRPTTRSLWAIRRACCELADSGGAAEVARGVTTLEKLWGPAAGWVGEGSTSATVEHTIEILSCAEGRALDADRIARAYPDPAPGARARLCAGLAREGRSDELREAMARVLGEALEPADLEVLIPAAIALDPGEGDRIRELLESEIGALPATSEAAAAWVREAEFG